MYGAAPCGAVLLNGHVEDRFCGAFFGSIDESTPGMRATKGNAWMRVGVRRRKGRRDLKDILGTNFSLYCRQIGSTCSLLVV